MIFCFSKIGFLLAASNLNDGSFKNPSNIGLSFIQIESDNSNATTNSNLENVNNQITEVVEVNKSSVRVSDDLSSSHLYTLRPIKL